MTQNMEYLMDHMKMHMIQGWWWIIDDPDILSLGMDQIDPIADEVTTPKTTITTTQQHNNTTTQQLDHP